MRLCTVHKKNYIQFYLFSLNIFKSWQKKSECNFLFIVHIVMFNPTRTFSCSFLRDKCFLCGSVEHQKRNCSKNKVVRTSVTPTTRLQKSQNNVVNLNSLFKTPYNNICVSNKTNDNNEVQKKTPELPANIVPTTSFADDVVGNQNNGIQIDVEKKLKIMLDLIVVYYY
jgi:hypothetical protein